ncbi:MAG TPA: hypothetical protein PK413_00685, partial [Thermoanaerobaculia bacterium]|nr:hypothetical protein [Thermoanaerobaculia bacterium]
MFADARIGPALILALVLLWAPLPFASVVVWADALLQVACLFLLVLVLKRPMDEAVWRRVRLPALALVVLAVLGLFQSMPIPRWLVALLAPGRAASVPGPTGLSFSPWFSLWTSLALASLAALLVASAGLGR